MRRFIVSQKVLPLVALLALGGITFFRPSKIINETENNSIVKLSLNDEIESKYDSFVQRHLPAKHGIPSMDGASHRTLMKEPIFLGNEALEFRSGSPKEGKRRVIVHLNKADPDARTNVVQKLKDKAGGENVHGFASVLRDYVVMDINQSFEQVLDEEDGVLDYLTDEPIKNEALECSVTSPQLWNKDRIDQPFLPLDNNYGLPNDGSGTTVYILDDGVHPHDELQDVDGPRPSRLTDYYDCFQKTCQLQNGGQAHESTCPEFGTGYHGTFVAGVCCGISTGIAPKATVVSLRIMDCDGNGFSSDFLTALDQAIVHCLESGSGNRCVINASLNGPTNPIMDAAVAEAVENGLVFVGSAGNANADSCNYSPARAPQGITVGASEIQNESIDAKASFSNWGNCVDIMAPGSNILGPYYLQSIPGQYGAASGTSFAAPLVAGAVALYLSGNPTAMSNTVKEAIISQSHFVTVDNKYPLLYVPGGCGAPQTVSPTSAPVKQPTASPVAEFYDIINLAAGRSTMQSTTYWFGGGRPNLAVDGNTASSFYDKSVSLTMVGNLTPWWRVDLYSPNNIINEVRIYNRKEFSSRLIDFEVSILDWDGNVVESVTHHSAAGMFVSIPFEGVRGRYVQITLNTDSAPLSLAEVEVMGHLEDPSIPVPINMALGKPTSGTPSLTPHSLAVDGDTSGDHSRLNSCFNSHYSRNPSWEVDLQVLTNIEHIILYNRQDKFLERLRNFRVEILNDKKKVLWSVDHPEAAGRVVEFHIDGGQQGQKVRVRILGRREYLTLAQVEVYGLPVA